MDQDLTSSFTTTSLNSTTFLIVESDSSREHPFIYAKLHPSAPILILNDSGCDSPDSDHQNARFTHLRDYIENYPLAINNNTPINPGPTRRTYVIICSHCHFDHTYGLPQFQDTSTPSTQIIASAQGRDFIESDLRKHGLFRTGPVPKYKVTHWAQSFERLTWPSSSGEQRVDLGITFIPQPGHTPDSLAWYDHAHMHLFVGDSLYEDGAKHNSAIIWPSDGNMVDWYYSMIKLLKFVKGENARAKKAAAGEALVLQEGWDVVEKRVKLGSGHDTSAGDAEDLIGKALKFLGMVVRNEVHGHDAVGYTDERAMTWYKEGYGMHFNGPVRLMDEARTFFNGEYDF